MQEHTGGLPVGAASVLVSDNPEPKTKLKKETTMDLALYKEMNEELKAFISLYRKRLEGANLDYSLARTPENKATRDRISAVLSKCLNAKRVSNDLSVIGKALYQARQEQRLVTGRN